MATLAMKCAVHERMKTKLQSFVLGAISSQMPAIESLFHEILTAARLEVQFSEEDMRLISPLVGAIFNGGNDKIQAKTFDFMEELIDILHYGSGTCLGDGVATAIAEFTKFYSSVVFRHSKSPTLFTEASEQVEEHVRETHPYRAFVLKAFEASLFGEYPIERYENKAVKNLLKILKQKIRCHGDIGARMPGIIRFIGNVCENQDSCGTVILMCGVLEDLLDRIVSRQADFEFEMFTKCSVLDWIMCHTSRFTPKKCWAAIAKFLKAVFLSGDSYLLEALLKLGVFSRIRYMMRNSSEILLMPVLDAVSVACANSRLNHHLVSENILLDTLQMVEDGRASRRVRMSACKIFSGFIHHAYSGDVFMAGSEGIIGAVVKLMKSRNELVVTSALRWILDIRASFEALDREKEFRSLLIVAKGDRVLGQLREKSDGPVGSLAQYIHGVSFASAD